PRARPPHGSGSPSRPPHRRTEAAAACPFRPSLRSGDMSFLAMGWPGGAVARDQGHNEIVTTAEVQRLGEGLGLDAVGVARAEAYAGTERHIRERRARGLFAGRKFTPARPEGPCRPEALPGAAAAV